MKPWEKYRRGGSSATGPSNGPWEKYARRTPERPERPIAEDRIAGAFEAADEVADQRLTTRTEAALRGAGQGLTAGFGDEITAAQQASGLPVWLDAIPLMAANRAALGALRTFFDDDASETYNTALERERRNLHIARQEHPVASIAGEVGGALATAPFTPAFRAAQGAGWLGRAGASAKTGAGYGAAYGFGTGEGGVENRLESAAQGAAAGFVAGGAASPVIDATIAGGRAARNFIAPMTPRGRERLAAEGLEEAATDPAAMRGALAESEELVPGSQPTTFQQTGDMGIGALERRVATQRPEEFMTRRGEQNTARLAALENIQSEGHPEAVARVFRNQIGAIERMTEATVSDAVEAASGRAARLGGEGTPEGYGEALRASLNSARTAAKARERELWKIVDPDGNLALPATRVRQAARDIREDVPASARGIEGEEAAIFEAASSLPRVAPFSEVTALRSRISTAMREELFARGQSPVYARLSQLRGAIEDDLERAVTQRAAEEADAVAAGTMRPEDTATARIQEWVDAWRTSRREDTANLGSVASGAAPSVSAGHGAGLPGQGRLRSAPRDPRLQADDGLQPNFDEAALERLRAATTATRERAQTFDAGRIGSILRRSGRDGPFNLPNAAVPERVFASGPRGFESVQNFRRAAGDEQAMLTLQDYAASRLRAVAQRADGSLDPTKVASWRARHADALRAFPELDARFADTARASEAIATAAAVRKSATDAYQKGLIGRIMGVEAPEDITRIIGSTFGRADGMALMRKLATLTKDDQEARQGLRKAIVDYMNARFVGNTEAATTGRGTMKSDSFQTFVRKNIGMLRQAFSESETNMMQRIALDLQRANRSVASVKLPGQSNTAQDSGSVLSKALREARRHTAAAMAGGAGLFTGGPITGLAAFLGAEVVRAMRQVGLRKVDDLIADAMLNPARARALLEKAPQRVDKGYSTRLARLYQRGAVFPAVSAATGADPEQAFDAETRTPSAILGLRRELEKTNPLRWEAVKRDYLTSVIGDALNAGAVLDPQHKGDAGVQRDLTGPDAMVAALTREPVQANMKAALTPEEWTRATGVSVVLRRAASLPFLRDPAALRTVSRVDSQDAALPLLKRLSDETPNVIADIRSLLKWSRADMEAHSQALSELILSDDAEAEKTIKELRRLSPWDKRWPILFGHLLRLSDAFDEESRQQAMPLRAPMDLSGGIPMAVGQ